MHEKDLDVLVLAFRSIGVPFLLSASKETTNLLVADAHFTFRADGEFVSVSAGTVTRNRVTPTYIAEDVPKVEPPELDPEEE